MNDEILHLDWETYGLEDLTQVGLDNYLKSANIWLASYAFNDEEVKTWLPGDRLEDRLIHHIQSGKPVWAHNAAFEVAICNAIAVPKHKWPGLREDQMVCTMAMAFAMALPGSLEKAAAAVGISKQKDMAGRTLMLQMCRPREIKPDGSVVWWNDAEKVQRLAAYGRQDVEVERELGKRLVQLSAKERKLFSLDQKINNRGIYVDLKSIRAAMAIVEAEKSRLDDEMRAVTNGAVDSCTKVSQLKTYLEDNLIIVDGVAKDDVTVLLDDPGLPEAPRKALMLRKEAAKSSTAKLKAMAQRASSDSRVRGAHQYCGAGTGRWAGRGIQIQNFPRGKYGKSTISEIFQCLHASNASQLIDLYFSNPLTVISNSLRSFITAAPGNVLRWTDFSGIEARVIAWLAGEEAVLKMFRDGGDPYVFAYARAFGVDPATVTKDQRQIGKVIVLALGFGGGVGAFQVMAKGYGVSLPDKEVDGIKKSWRQAHQNIVNFWYNLERGAMAAIRSPGEVVVIGTVPSRAVKYKKSGSFLWCQLPSERLLCYPYPKIEPVEFINPTTKVKSVKDGITYNGEHPKTGKWERLKAYGGLLAENITQAVARDLLAEKLTRFEAASYFPVFHTHDEAVAETPKNFGSLSELIRIAEIVPHWAKDLPIKAEGDEGERYCK